MTVELKINWYSY